jgi:hypothetical protein
MNKKEYGRWRSSGRRPELFLHNGRAVPRRGDMKTWQAQWAANEAALAAHDSEVEAFREARAGARAAFKAKHGKEPFPPGLAANELPRHMYARQSRLVDRQTALVARHGQGLMS